MLPYVHERFEMVTPPELASEPGAYHGHDGLRRWFSSFYEAMEEIRIEPRRIEPVGDHVLVAFRMIARGRSSGLEMVQEAVGLTALEDGLLVEIQFFTTWDEATAAAAAA